MEAFLSDMLNYHGGPPYRTYSAIIGGPLSGHTAPIMGAPLVDMLNYHGVPISGHTPLSWGPPYRTFSAIILRLSWGPP